MSQPAPYILVVDDEPQILELLKLTLESLYPGEVRTASCVEEARGILRTQPNADLIVTDHNMPGETGDALERFVLERGWRIPFVVCSGRPKDQVAPLYRNLQAFIEKPQVLDPLTQITKSLVRPSGAPRREYVGVSVATLIELGLVDFELFVRIGKDKFVKISHSSEYFDPADARRLLAKKVNVLYVRALDSPRLLRAATNGLLALEGSANVDPGEAFSASNSSSEIVQCLYQAFGWTREVEDLVRQGTNLALRALKSSPDILALLERHHRSVGTYVSSHSNALIYLCCGISRSMEWHSDLTSAKLTMAALLHDLPLEPEELEKARHLNALAFSGERTAEIEHYLGHPIQGVELLSGIKNVPPDIDRIILQHHERPDGRGFPSGIDYTRFTPLSALFVIAEDLVGELEERPGEDLRMLVQDFVSSRADYYCQGVFKKILANIAVSLQG